ncbi:MAG: hypothetical protein WCY16_00700 [Weeksellaceae bacterium]
MLTFKTLKIDQSLHIINLIEKVQIEENRAKKFALQLLDELERKKSLGIVDEYNIRFHLQCFDAEKELNYQTSIPSLLYLEEEFSMNWNEHYFTKDTPLEKIYIGYSMHYILFNDLSIENILKIENVWIEVVVDFQFFTLKV